MKPTRTLPRTARVIAWTGGALFWALHLTLLLVLELPLPDSILLPVLLVGVPTLSLVQLSVVKGALIERLPAYWGSIGTLWLLGAASWLVGTRIAGPAALGIVLPAPWSLVVWSIGLTIACLMTILVFRELASATGASERRLLRELLPRSPEERRVFAVLSLAAGFGEEVAYRGYAVPVLAPLLGVPGAVAATSGVFGILHGYQGLLGTLRAGTMGGILAWGFLASGSLWPAIISHTIVDLIAGIVLGERLLPRVVAVSDTDLLSSAP